MPPPTASLKPTAQNGNGTAAPKSAAAGYHPKPDQQAYNAEQDGFNKQIDGIKTQLSEVRAKLDLTRAPTSENDRRSVLKAEMDSLRGDQGKFKGERSKVLDEVKRLNELVQKKIKDVQAQRSKLPYKTTEEIDQRISALDRDIESGKLTLLNEKKSLQEITNLRRARKQVEASQEVDRSIAADRAKIDDLRKQLDDPEAKQLNDRFDALKKELDSLRDEGNKAWEEKNKLFDQRNALQAELDAVYAKKRESATAYREAGDKYWAKVQEERQAKQDRYKSEKAKEDAARREEQVEQMREAAKTPAYAAEIEDCSVLIGWFNGRYGGASVPETNASRNATAEKTIAGVKALDIRKVDDDVLGVQLKKKEEETWGGFGGGGKKKGGKGKKATPASGAGSGSATPDASGGAINLPMHLLTALLSLSISPPSSKDDVSRAISDLETKKAWFEANSAAKTKAEIERVEKEVAKILKKNKGVADDDEPQLEQEIGGAHEPPHTVAVEGEAVGKDTVLTSGSQLPTEDNEDDAKLKHVDSELEEIKANGE